MTTETKWFHFSQNNTGGDFDTDFGHQVVIEATDYRHANDRAEQVGLYFNGCETGRDCSCCGDRWHPTWKGDGTDVPSVYGQPVNEPDTSDLGGMFSRYWDGARDIQVVPLEGESFFMARGDALPELLASRLAEHQKEPTP